MKLDYVKVPFTNNPTMTRFDGPIYNKNPDKQYLIDKEKQFNICLLYTSPSPRDLSTSRMPSSA